MSHKKKINLKVIMEALKQALRAIDDRTAKMALDSSKKQGSVAEDKNKKPAHKGMVMKM